jgi:hypothetical protein
MKRVIIQSFLNICMYFLAAFFISSIHDQLQLFQNDPVSGTGFNLTLDLSIILPILLVAIGLSITGYWMRTDKKTSFSKWSSSTTEFSDQDEREEVITGKATRTSYVTFLITLPVLMISFLFDVPLMATFPSFPFYAIALVLTAGTLSYMTAWVYYYQK